MKRIAMAGVAALFVSGAAIGQSGSSTSTPSPQLVQQERKYQAELKGKAKLDQARRDTGRGLEGPDLGDGRNGSRYTKSASGDEPSLQDGREASGARAQLGRRFAAGERSAHKGIKAPVSPMSKGSDL